VDAAIFARFCIELVPAEASPMARPRILHLFRFECERKWINEHSSDINSVFHCDLFH
jgi:hypothetical protein